MTDIADLTKLGIGGIRFAVLKSYGGGVANVALTPGSGHVPADILTLTGGTFSRGAKIGVGTTQAISAVVNAGGSGGSNGAVTITGTTGTGTKFQATGTISGGALTGALTVTVVGDYSVNPTSLAAEPVTGGSLAGATVTLVMGVGQFVVTDQGNYSVIPTGSVQQGSSTGSGVGAAFTLGWGIIAAVLESESLTFGRGNLSIGGNQNGRVGEAGIGGSAGGQCVGAESTFIGCGAGGRVTLANFNTAVGHNALGIGAGVPVTGSSNSAFGTDCMRDIGSTAHDNVAMGVNACRSLTTAFSNVGVGVSALQNLQTSVGNVAVGFSALSSITTSASDNTAVGQNAGLKTTGAQNTIVGSKAIGGATGGAAAANTVIGYNAGNLITSGGTNTIIGANVASTTLLTGSGNILIGTSSAVDTPATGTANYLNIGALIFGDLSNGRFSLGLTTPAVSWLGIAAGTTAKSQMNLAVSAAPTSPVDGDIWFESNTNTGLKMRVNGVTKSVTLA